MYPELYPGIDLVYKIHDGSLKYEFVVVPNADYNLIQMRYPDADMIDVNDDHITITKSEFSFSDTGLWTFQKDGGIVDVECSFQLHELDTIGFVLGSG